MWGTTLGSREGNTLITQRTRWPVFGIDSLVWTLSHAGTTDTVNFSQSCAARAAVSMQNAKAQDGEVVLP